MMNYVYILELCVSVYISKDIQLYKRIQENVF